MKAHLSCSQESGECDELVIDGVSVRYGSVIALDDISMKISCGRRLALVGPNGAGKSTLIKALAGLVPMSKGFIKWRGKELLSSCREIAYLAQSKQVDWDFPITVRGLVEMGRYPHVGWWRMFGEKDRNVVEAALETMHLEDLSGRQISALSGGQQQRAFIARSLAQEAKTLLLDEPFTGLDRPSQDLLSEILGDLAAENHLVIASHHDLETVADTFDDVLLLNRSVSAFGSVGDVLNTTNLNNCFPGQIASDGQNAPRKNKLNTLK